MRYFLEVSYDGTAYSGWQVQPNGVTVQAQLEECLRKILRNPELGVVGSGRTDAGVHAGQQWLHVDHHEPLSMEVHGYKLNKMLPPDIGVHQVRRVTEEAHARFSATERRYEYTLIRQKDPFRRHKAYWFGRPLEVDRMNEAAQLLLSWEDFECFSKVKTQVNTFLCDITRAEWVLMDNETLRFFVNANRFLRGMVRAIVGTLLEVGLGQRTVAEFQQVLESRDRQRAGSAAPPQGLSLVRVVYPQDIFID